MGCNCKNAVKISEANPTEQNWLESTFSFIKKILLFILAICLTILVTPIIIIVISYNIIFKRNGSITIPTKVLNMLK